MGYAVSMRMTSYSDISTDMDGLHGDLPSKNIARVTLTVQQ